MPNATQDSVLLAALKTLIGLLSPKERAALRPWLLARYGVDGHDAPSYPERRGE